MTTQLSSYTSSKSFLHLHSSGGAVQGPNSLLPPAQAERLPTGLKLILDEAFVTFVLRSEKPRDALQDMLVRYLRREGTLENFEKMEIVLLADYHYFNLVFCKDELLLSNRKTAIMMNVLWMLLINNNQGYENSRAEINDGPELHTGMSSHHDEDDNLHKKTLESDVALFKNLLLSLSYGKTEEELQALGVTKDVTSMKLFSQQEIKRTVEYAHLQYIDKFNLYKYVFQNKKKSEEVKLQVCISQPIKVPPLKDALYTAFDKQVRHVVETESLEHSRLQSNASEAKDSEKELLKNDSLEAIQEEQLNKGLSDQKSANLVSPDRILAESVNYADETGRTEIEKKISSQSNVKAFNTEEEDQNDEDIKLIDQRFNTFKKEVDGEIQTNDQMIDEKIATKGKKKK